MSEVLVLSRQEVDRLLDRAALRQVLLDAFVALSSGRTDVPPRIATRSPAGMLVAMPGHVPAAGMAVKLVSVFPGNRELDLPSHLGLIALFDGTNGSPLAVMDAALITEVRTSMTAAIAADLLSRDDAAILTIIGAGAQAHGHLQTFAPIRRWREVRLVNRTRARADELAGQHADVIVFDDVATAVRGADVVACCTDAPQPPFALADLGDGVHVSSVGVGEEVPREVLDAAHLVAVEWRGAVEQRPPAGARELQGRDPRSVVELGELLAGPSSDRVERNQLTVYKSTGHAVEDVVAARLVYDAARRTGTGTPVSV